MPGSETGVIACAPAAVAAGGPWEAEALALGRGCAGEEGCDGVQVVSYVLYQ